MASAIIQRLEAFHQYFPYFCDTLGVSPYYREYWYNRLRWPSFPPCPPTSPSAA
jgi:hypothetical protein